MQLYVANGTYQNMNFNYRTNDMRRGIPGFRVLRIPAGGQAQFSEDFTSDGDVRFVIEQLERVGARPYSDVVAIRTPRCLVYRVQRQLESNVIDEARERDERARQEMSAQKTEESGLAAFDVAEKKLPSGTVKTSLEVQQLSQRGDRTEKGGVDTVVEVTRSTRGRKESRKK